MSADDGREILQRQHEEIQGLDDKVYDLARELSELKGGLTSYAKETDMSDLKGQMKVWTIAASLIVGGLGAAAVFLIRAALQ